MPRRELNSVSEDKGSESPLFSGESADRAESAHQAEHVPAPQQPKAPREKLNPNAGSL